VKKADKPGRCRNPGLACVIGGLLACLVGKSLPAANVTDVSWMSGCWVFDGGEYGSGEFWTQPAGSTLIGISRTVRNGTTTGFEFMRIIEIDGGELMFIASPSGQATTTFVMASISDDEIVFENPDHDFPQRVGYRRLAAQSSRPGLLGWIDGDIDGQHRRIEFPMTSVDCATTPGDE
jgi:hypothetical protein